MRKSVLFLTPDYHNSFTLAANLRRRGWRTAVFVPEGFSEQFLFASTVLRQWKISGSQGTLGIVVNKLAALLQYAILSVRYRVHVTYGRMNHPPTFEHELRERGWTGDDFHLGLCISRWLGVSHVLVPTGCRDEDLKERFLKLEGEEMCGNCGFFDRCHDKENSYFLARARRYADLRIDSGFYGSTAMTTTPVRFKGLDLDRWTVPDRSDRTSIVVLHSHAAENRNLMPGRNIKGTPIIDAVMERICATYPHVEYRRVTGLRPAEMLAEQQAADIVIDQLFYGHWGSTGIESMGVGCAVVCYLRPPWVEQFKRNFPNAPEMPVVSATRDTLEEVVERLVTDRQYLRDVQAASRRFAEDFYDPTSVSAEFEAMLLDLRRAGRHSA